MDPLEALAAAWREQAARYEADGQPGAALLRRVAGELEAAVRALAIEALTLREAAAELGLSYSTVQRKVATGELPNAGTTHRPRVRRCDLRRRGPTGGPDLVAEVLA
jgi:excisionase family DNA binding protein